jgi:hypothetical protein
MAAPGASGITPKPTPRPTPGPSRAASIKDDDSETIAAEEADRFVVKSLDMQVKEGGKNFSAGEHRSLQLTECPSLTIRYLCRPTATARSRSRDPQAQVVVDPDPRRIDGQSRLGYGRAHSADHSR